MKKVLIFILFFSSISFSQKIAVLDFKAVGYLDTQEVRALSERLRSEIVKTEKFEVMERQEMMQIDKEIASQLGAGFDKNRVAEYGKKKGAAYIVICNIGLIGKRYAIDVKMINCTTTKIEKSYIEDYKGDLEGLLDVMHKIAFNMAGIKEKSNLWKWITGGVVTVGGIVTYLIISGNTPDATLPGPPSPPSGF